MPERATTVRPQGSSTNPSSSILPQGIPLRCEATAIPSERRGYLASATDIPEALAIHGALPRPRTWLRAWYNGYVARKATNPGLVVFVRVGHLEHYNSRHDTERLVGGGAFNDTDTGSELENFRAWRGKLYGYAETPSGGGFTIARISPAAADDWRIDGVLVVFVAVANAGSGQVIVGWYRNATVFDDSKQRPGGLYGVYNIIAPEAEAVLLPLPERRQPAFKGKGGFGQANVFYVFDLQGQRRTSSWIREALEFIARYPGPSRPRHDARQDDSTPRRTFDGQGRRSDAAKNEAVELAAMRLATEHFSKLGYRVTDVSAYEPFDLVCRRRGQPELRVEVKGTTGAARKVIVTDREVASARSHRTALFVASRLELQESRGKLIASGGSCRCIDHWQPAAASLRAVQFEYTLPDEV